MSGVHTELGADVCHKANKWCLKFAKQFGLNLSFRGSSEDPRSQDVESDKEGTGIGIWDGKEIIYVSSPSSYTIANLFNMWYRYGFDVISLLDPVTETLNRWQRLYDTKTPWRSLKEFLSRFELTEFTNVTLDKFLSAKGYSQTSIDEIVSGITLVIYQQTAYQLHALSGLISLAASLSAEDLFDIVEGNDEIPAKLVEHSKAELRLRTAVEEIVFVQDRGQYIVRTKEGEEIFEDVIVSVPLEISGIKLIGVKEPPRRDYVHVFVTLIHGVLNPSYFGYEDISLLPPKIITTANSTSPFTVMGIREVFPDNSQLVKFFSRNQTLPQKEIDQIFSKVHKTLVQEWYAYPYAPPLQDHSASEIELSPGLFYPSAFESVGTTMECSMISSRNAVELLLERHQLVPNVEKETMIHQEL
eukprot:TRINITY_DN3385_c0_g1_i2.p1 TRINITY_DN3385_c0_g1~~TRINITY_DN3385_c0_g1_i2.p1  ORF type:complete len:480 (-),score=53.81 TRINITY_DN3385_c0_g1_i2:75-1319(-)